MPGMIELSNGCFAARIAEAGAELQSLVDLSTRQEHIWCGDPAWWKGSAPVLFPVIGGLKDGGYTWEGRQYMMSSHGFARTSAFTVTRSAEDSAELELCSSAATREMYPFDFSLRVGFSLERAGMAVRYEVRNTGTGPMLFSIGSHPAFVVPFAGGSLENYYLLFEREEQLPRLYFKDGLVVAGKTGDALDNCRVISITRNLFDDGILIFRGPQSTEFSLRNSMNARSVTVATDGVPYLGLWSKPAGAPFVCVEPWHGIPDSTDASGRLEDKEGIRRLEPRGVFSTGYRIEIA
jgi:galactose mutarotase-like enzyme